MRWGPHSHLYDSHKIDAAALEAAARERWLSLKTLDVERPDAAWQTQSVYTEIKPSDYARSSSHRCCEATFTLR